MLSADDGDGGDDDNDNAASNPKAEDCFLGVHRAGRRQTDRRGLHHWTEKPASEKPLKPELAGTRGRRR